MKNKIISLLVGLACALQLSVTAIAQEEETIYNLPWTIGEAEVDLLHIPATFKLPKSQAIVTGNAAIDFERLGFGQFTFRAPAVLVNLTEGNDILDNIYIHYYDIGYVSMDNWSQNANAGQLQKAFEETLLISNKLRPDAGKLQFSKWVETPILHRDNATIYYAIELDQADGGKWINAKAMKLTRHGYILVTWIGEPKLFQSAEHNLTPILDSLIIDEGKAYSDFDEGEDDVAGDDAGSLLEKTIKGEAITTGAAKGALLAVVLGFAKKLWWLIIIPFVGAWKWYKGKQDGSSIEGTSESRMDKYYKHLWKALFALGLLITTILLIGVMAFNNKSILTDDSSIKEITGIVLKANQEDNNIENMDLTLAGNEQPFRFEKIAGIKSSDIWDAILKSYNEGSRLVLKYHAGQIPEDSNQPIQILAIRSGEDIILPIEASIEKLEKINRLYIITTLLLLIIPLAMFIAAYVIYSKVQSEHKYPKQVLWWVKIPTIVASLFLVSLMHISWSLSQERLADSLEADGDYEEAFKVADFALTWGLNSTRKESNLYYVRAESFQELGRSTNNDDQLFASIADFEEAMRLDPDLKDKAIKQIGYSLTYLGAYDEATEAFKKINSTLDALIRQALVQRILGNYEAATALYQQGYEVNDKWYGMPINYHRAKNYVLAKDYKAAMEAIDIGLEHQIDYRGAYMIRGCAKASLANIDGSISDYEHAIELWDAYNEKRKTPRSVSEYRRGIETQLDLIKSLNPLDENFDVTNYDFCSIHNANGEIKRERSSLLPDIFERDYLMAESAEGAE